MATAKQIAARRKNMYKAQISRIGRRNPRRSRIDSWFRRMKQRGR